MVPIGSWLSLITKAEVRYVGRLVDIDFDNASLVLDRVVLYGTEGRVKDGIEEVLPHRTRHDLRVEFEAASLKEVFLLPQQPSEPQELGITDSRREFRQDDRESEDLNRRPLQRNAYAESSKIVEPQRYDHQQRAGAQHLRQLAQQKRPEHKPVEDIPERIPYDFELPPEADTPKHKYDGTIYEARGKQNDYKASDYKASDYKASNYKAGNYKASNYKAGNYNSKSHRGYEDNQYSGMLAKEPEADPLRITEADVIESLKNTHISQPGKSTKKLQYKLGHSESTRAYNHDDNHSDPHYMGPKKGTQDRTANIRSPEQQHHGAGEGRDNSQRKFKPSSVQTMQERHYRQGARNEPIHGEDGPVKNTRNPRQRKKDTYPTPAKQQIPQNILEPLDVNEIYGQTSTFAMRQKSATSVENIIERKSCYTKDSFFDDLSCASKDRASKVEITLKGKRFEENNINMQTFGETLNPTRHPRFFKYNNYRRNQQNGLKRDYNRNCSTQSLPKQYDRSEGREKVPQ